MDSFENRRVLVVGGASGIGLATASLCHSRGARVAIADIDEDRGRAAAAEMTAVGRAVHYYHVDVTDEQSVRSMLQAAEGDLGALDGLVPTAGLQLVGMIEDISTQDWSTMFDINVRGQFYIMKHAVSLLRAGDQPSVVLLGSGAGLRGAPGSSCYSATKGAVMSLARALAIELAPTIRVNALCPGWVETDFNKHVYEIIGGSEQVAEMVSATVPLQRQARPVEIANYIAFLLSPEASYVTAKIVVADGGQN